MSRQSLAGDLAEQIRQIEHCEILSNTALTAIEQTLSAYAVECLSGVRQNVREATWGVVEKVDALRFLDEAIRRA